MRAFVDGTRIDIDPEKVPAFTFELFDPLEPGSVKGSSAPKMKLVATPEVQEVFGSHQMSEDVPSSTKRLYVMEGSAVIHEAVVVPTDWTRDYVEVAPVGDSASWMGLAKATKIGDLDLGKVGPLDANVIKASWLEGNVIFPVIDYGLFQSRAFDYDVQVAQLWPGVRVLPVLQKAFTSFGYSLQFDGQCKAKIEKLIIPFTGKEVEATTEQLTDHILIAELSAPTSPVFGGALNEAEMIVDTAVSDVSGQFDSGGLSAALRGRANVFATANIRFESVNPLTTGDSVVFFVYYKIGSTFYGGQTFNFNAPGPGVQEYTLNVELRDMPIVPSPVLRSHLTFRSNTPVGSDPNYFEIMSCSITYEPIMFDYQEGIEFYLNSTVPKMTIADLLGSCCKALNLVADTDEGSKSIIVRHMDEHFLPVEQGEDWTGVQDMAVAPLAEKNYTPRFINFRWKEENNDKGTDEWTKPDAYGSGVFDLGAPRVGSKDIEVPFAPTYMGFRFDATKYIPLIIDKGNTGNTEAKTSSSPRLLYFDGLILSQWTLDGSAVDEFPYCYFVPLETAKPSLAFGNETQGGPVVIGTITRHHSNHLARLRDNRLFTARVALDDIDVMGRNFRTPKLLGDGAGKGWYALTSIKNYLWGGRRTTEVKAIKL